MKKISTIAALILICLVAMNVYAVQKDDPKCQDHPLFTRMPGYWIHGCDHKQFDGADFKIAEKGKVVQTIRVEGELWMVRYYPRPT